MKVLRLSQTMILPTQALTATFGGTPLYVHPHVLVRPLTRDPSQAFPTYLYLPIPLPYAQNSLRGI
jgi:hypothetical protein